MNDVAVDKVRVLTLWRPWDQLIVEGSKDVENRPTAWDVTGCLLVLHAGQQLDYRLLDPARGTAKLCEMAARELGQGWSNSTTRRAGYIVGAARVVKCGTPAQLGLTENPWAFGPYCMQLDQRVAFPRADWREWRGRQGLTKLPTDLEAHAVRVWTRAVQAGEAL